MKIFGDQPISTIGEKLLIERVREILGDVCPPSPYGSGDDCALVEKRALAENIYTTVDSVIAGRHFDLDTPPELAAEKLVKRNISDIASMGAKPEFALCCAIVSDNLSMPWLEKFTQGLSDTARKYGVKIVGGDFSSAGVDNFFSMSLTLTGSSDMPALLRSGAKEGDYIYCTGRLGFSYESGRHLTFTPRVQEGQWLVSWNCKVENIAKITSCTDISDGLACDIENILSPNCKAILDFIPQNEFEGETNLNKSLCDGEDYELLFSLSANSAQAEEFEKSYFEKFSTPIYKLGTVQKKGLPSESPISLNIDGSVIGYSSKGFKHFKNAPRKGGYPLTCTEDDCFAMRL